MSMNNSGLDRILSKIKKCMALGESSEPAEAAAALRQAQKLMAKYNIDQTTMQLADIGEARVKSKVSVSIMKPWEQNLIRLVARAFGCKIIWHPSSSYAADVYGSYGLVGLKTQVKLAEYAATVLMRKLINSRRQFMTTLPPQLSRQSKMARGDGFALGWVEAVAPTVHEFAGWGALKPLVDQYVRRELGPLGKASQRRMSYSPDAAEHGRAAGAGVSLHHAVDGASQRLLS